MGVAERGRCWPAGVALCGCRASSGWVWPVGQAQDEGEAREGVCAMEGVVERRPVLSDRLRERGIWVWVVVGGRRHLMLHSPRASATQPYDRPELLQAAWGVSFGRPGATGDRGAAFRTDGTYPGLVRQHQGVGARHNIYRRPGRACCALAQLSMQCYVEFASG
jgi:hypothetical protein